MALVFRQFLRVLGADGTGYNSDIAQGLLFAGLPNGSGQTYSGSVPIKVINMSLGSVGWLWQYIPKRNK